MVQKIVLKVQLNCEKCKQRAMETVAGVEGIILCLFIYYEVELTNRSFNYAILCTKFE